MKLSKSLYTTGIQCSKALWLKKYKSEVLAHNGGEAMNAYANMSNLSYEEKMVYRRALLEYCKLDTLAMVNVLKKLKEI